MKIIFRLLLIVSLFNPVIANSQVDYDVVPDVTDVIMINDVQLIDNSNENRGFCDILIEKGIIKEIKSQIIAPYDALIVEGDSAFVYASFIDGFSNVANSKPKRSEEAEAPEFPGFPTPKEAGIQSDRSMTDIINYNDGDILSLQSSGFGISHVAPEGKMLPGKTAIILLNGKKDESIILRKDHAQYFQLVGTRGIYPSTIIGVMAKWKELIYQTRLLREHKEKNLASPLGTQKALYSSVHESLIPVVQKSMPVYMNAEKIKTIFRGLELQDALAYNMVMVDVKQGWDAIMKLKEQNIKIMLSLDLPKEEKSDKDKDKGKDKGSDKSEDAPRDPLMLRKKASADAYKAQAFVFESAKIPFAFSMLSAKAKDVKSNIIKMVESGLSKKMAMEALTINAAKILGIDQFTGSIEIGKMANMILTDKDYFDASSHIKMNIINGQIFEYPKKKKTDVKGDAKLLDDIIGTWSFKTQVEDETRTGLLKISQEDNNIEVILVNDAGPSVENIGSEIELDGALLSFKVNIVEGDMTIPVSFRLNFSTNAFEGNVEVQNLGNYPISGEKITSPE